MVTGTITTIKVKQITDVTMIVTVVALILVASIPTCTEARLVVLKTVMVVVVDVAVDLVTISMGVAVVIGIVTAGPEYTIIGECQIMKAP